MSLTIFEKKYFHLLLHRTDFLRTKNSRLLMTNIWNMRKEENSHKFRNYCIMNKFIQKSHVPCNVCDMQYAEASFLQLPASPSHCLGLAIWRCCLRILHLLLLNILFCFRSTIAAPHSTIGALLLFLPLTLLNLTSTTLKRPIW